MQYRVIGHTATRLIEGWSELMQEVKTVPTLVGPNLGQHGRCRSAHICFLDRLDLRYTFPRIH